MAVEAIIFTILFYAIIILLFNYKGRIPILEHKPREIHYESHPLWRILQAIMQRLPEECKPEWEYKRSGYDKLGEFEVYFHLSEYSNSSIYLCIRKDYEDYYVSISVYYDRRLKDSIKDKSWKFSFYDTEENMINTVITEVKTVIEKVKDRER